MASYPKFLKSSAKIFGFTLFDLGQAMALVLFLNLAKVPGIVSLSCAIIFLLIKILLKRLFDLRYLFILYPRIKTVRWYEWMRRY